MNDNIIIKLIKRTYVENHYKRRNPEISPSSVARKVQTLTNHKMKVSCIVAVVLIGLALGPAQIEAKVEH